MATWTIDRIANEVKRRREDRVCCALLTGAGCSYQAGIPLASGFVEQIEKRFPDEYALADPKSYPQCMAQLARADRHKLVCEYVDKAKINWAHISIAQMMRAGFVDRVLTTNFDPLVVRACALLNLYPAVYDMAVVRNGFVADYVRDRAVFHLHGQRDGFVQLHDKAQVDALRETIEPLFDDTARQRVWIVVGYSGRQDPVFEALADRPEFPNRLFWTGFRDEQPSADLRAALFDAGKGAEWISGYDPDTFLLQLADRLGCFPPGFFARPFSHLLECFATLAGFRPPGQDQELDWAARARSWVEQAKATFEPAEAPPAGATAAAPAPSAPLRKPPPRPPAFAPAPATRDAAAEPETVAGPAPGGAPGGAPPAAGGTAPGAVPSSDPVGAAWAAMMSGDYDRVIELAPEFDSGRLPQLGEPLAHALSLKAQALQAEAATADPRTRLDLLRKAAGFAQRGEQVQLRYGAMPVRGREKPR